MVGGMRRVAIALLAAHLALAAHPGCAKRPKRYERRTPRAAVEAFFAALGEGRFPDDLEAHVHDSVEVGMWQGRCKFRGCKRAEVTVHATRMLSTHRAEVTIDYLVRGDGGRRVVSARGSPVTVVREGDDWYIVQIGRRVSVESSDSPAPVDDAAPSP